MSTSLPPVRRIVTGIDASGRSYIAEDGVSPAMMTMQGREGYRNNNLWRTLGSSAPVDAPDSVLEHRGVLPPQGGTVLRVIDIPPEDKDPEAAASARPKRCSPRCSRTRSTIPSHARHPGMHVTDTIDYAIVLQGELVAIMDEGETRDARRRHPDPARHRITRGRIAPAPSRASHSSWWTAAARAKSARELELALGSLHARARGSRVEPARAGADAPPACRALLASSRSTA